MTPRQVQVLQWLRDNPSDRAGWLVNGKPVRNEPPEKWTHMEVAGESGSIRIASDDMRALRGLVTGCPSPDKIYGVSDLGLAALDLAQKTAEGTKP
jgi:hypothetical protein